MPARRASGPLLSRHIPPGSGRLSRRSRAHDADLGDTPTVHRGDLEPVALDLDRVSDGREAAEAAKHETADRVVWLVRQLDAEALAESVERCEPIDHERARAFFFERRRFAIELVVDLADELLDDVLERHEPGRAAEFIEDDRELHALASELGQ